MEISGPQNLTTGAKSCSESNVEVEHTQRLYLDQEKKHYKSEYTLWYVVIPCYYLYKSIYVVIVVVVLGASFCFFGQTAATRPNLDNAMLIGA